MSLRSSTVFLAALPLLVLAFTPDVANACETCKVQWLTPQNIMCKPVKEGEMGRMTCEMEVDIVGISCFSSGEFCEGMTVIDDGGDNPCVTSGGACPAECFSCTSGGGGGYVY